MFIKIYDTLINCDYIVRVNPIATIYKDGEEAYALVTEVVIGGRIEGRQYTFEDKTEAEEILAKIEESLL
jgi:hypothetical protein